jgi:multidrug transporter EmrE-like cation transporter
MMAWLILVHATVSAAGFALRKLGMTRNGQGQVWLQTLQQPSFWIGGLLYGAGFAIWLSLMRRFPLAVVFPIAAGSVFAMTCMIDILLFSAPPSARTVVGGLVILAGIAISAGGR